MPSNELTSATELPNINQSGLTPVEWKCLIRLKKVEEVTESGFYIAKQTVQKEQWAETEATLIEIGGNAFSDWSGARPQPGDNIIVRQYSATHTYDGDDGEKYQLIIDKDILGVDRRKKK